MKKRKAVFTIVKNEKVMLSLWMKYYSKYFDNDDIYVLDHQTTDGSTDNLPCKIRQVASDTAFNHAWLNKVVRNFQCELLKLYEYVLFVEADEFVFHKDGLGNYIDRLTQPAVGCNGFELQHLRGHEADIDLSRPILHQRSFWYPNIEYSKTLLSSYPVFWGLGFHECENPWPLDPELYLIHLHRFDYKTALQKNEERAKLNWNKWDVERGHGFQNRILGEEFENWFERFRKLNIIQVIPDELRESEAF